MAEIFEPKIVYARELDKNQFTLVVAMIHVTTKRPTYLGGTAVLADITARSTSPSTLSMDLKINFLDYKEVRPGEFIEEDIKANKLLSSNKLAIENKSGKL